MGRLLADSTSPATNLNATANQMMLTLVSVSRANARSHSTGLAVASNLSSSATPVTTTSAAMVCSRVPSTWPARIELRAIAMVRKRLMMPSVMSIATPCAAPATDRSMIPGTM